MGQAHKINPAGRTASTGGVFRVARGVTGAPGRKGVAGMTDRLVGNQSAWGALGFQAAKLDPPMDAQTEREIWLLAIGTALIEAPLAAVAVLAILGH
ncbi:MAG: hypothetical protein QOF22_2138 [Bradyrhizobium sp.]|jgi:hypothetical protein|nr:hypothetical protein [Bradyrhizobium sp.]